MFCSQIKQFILNNRSSGKRECFMWENEGLDAYINWAFSRNNLFYVSDENGPIGVGVAYALPKPYNGSIDSLLPYDDEIENEHQKDLVIMDWIAANSNARKILVKQFKQRFWNWENQDKYGVHYGKTKKLNNNYINKLS